MNPNTKKLSKKQMIETINKAIAKMEAPFPVSLTKKAENALRNNPAKLEYAYKFANYILTWDYGRIPGDSPAEDYKTMMNAIEAAFYEPLIDTFIAR